MIPELRSVWKQWGETQHALQTSIHELPADRWQWRPAPQARSASELISHTMSGDALYALVIRDEMDQVEHWRVRINDYTGALESFTRVEQLIQETFEGLTPTDLTRVCALDWNPLGLLVEGQLDVMWFCQQMVRHKAYHLGQLNYLRLLLEGQE